MATWADDNVYILELDDNRFENEPLMAMHPEVELSLKSVNDDEENLWNTSDNLALLEEQELLSEYVSIL